MKSGSAEFAMGMTVGARAQGGGPTGRGSVYTIRDTQGVDYTCEYLDLVTVGFRTLKVGDRVRFQPQERADGLRVASHVIKVDQPPAERLYGGLSDPAGVDAGNGEGD